MRLPIVLNGSIVLFVVQLVLCLKLKRPIWKWLPVIVVGAGDGICLILTYALHTREVAFGFFGLAMIGWVWLAGLGAAWLVYGLVKLVQKLKRNLSCKEKTLDT